MHRILLVNPHGTAQTGYSNPPLGLLYLAGALLAKKIETQIVDGCLEGRDAIDRAIRAFKPTIVGITCLTPGRKQAIDVASMAKLFDPSVFVVMGGAHPTIMFDQMLNNYPEIDAIVLGEGEETLVELALGNDLLAVSGLAIRNEGAVVRTTPRPQIADLDSLPFPAWHLLDLRRYPSIGTGSYRGIDLNREPRVSIIFSRGCKGHCHFCSTWWIWRGWRRRSPQNMVDEIQHLYDTQGIRHFCFADDSLTVDREATIELCDEIIRRGLVIAFHATTRTDCVDEVMLKKLAEAGCYNIAFGVETGSSELLTGMMKENEIATAERAITLAKSSGITTTALMIIGNVGETPATIAETVRFLQKVDPDVLGCTGALWILPGTHLYRTCKERGFIDDSFWLGDEPYKIYDLEYSLEQLNNFEQIVRNYRTQPRELQLSNKPASLRESNSDFLAKWNRYTLPEVNEYSDTTAWVDAQSQHIELMPILPSGCLDVLDLGCGDGWSTNQLIKREKRATGVTVNPAEAVHAKKTYGLDLIVRDMHNLPFDDGSFDGIYCRECFEHSVAPFIALCEMNRVLRAGGYVLINLPWEEWIREDSHYSVLTPSQMREMFFKCKFVVAKEGRTAKGHYWYLGRKITEVGLPFPYPPPIPGKGWIEGRVIDPIGAVNTPISTKIKPDIVCQMRIKNEARWLRPVLDAIAMVASCIVILDDGSTDETPSICRAHPAVKDYRWQEESQVDEVRDKNRLLKMAMAFDPEWILCMDGDEMLEEDAPEKIQAAIAACPEGVAIMDFRFLYMWNDIDHFRDDGIYHNLYHHRLFRLSGQDKSQLSFTPTGHGGNFHCESVPPNIVGGSMAIDLDIKHLGYMYREDRERKHAWYNQLDTSHAMTGYYDHLLDQPQMIIRSWESRHHSAQHQVNSATKQEHKPDYYYANARREVIDHVPSHAKRVLDVGCGLGFTGGLLRAERGIEVMGLEIHPDIAEAARKHLDSVVVGDFETIVLPWPEGYFDTIIAADVLEHLVDPWAALTKLIRYLSPGGTIVASLPNIRNLDALGQVVEGSFAYKEQGILDRTHLRFFARRDMVALLTGAGLHTRVAQIVRDPLFAGINLDAISVPANIEHGRLTLKAQSRDELNELTAIQFILSASKPGPILCPAGAPKVSVIIPVFNQWVYTQACLDSVFAIGARLPIEVIVVDDASSDETQLGLLAYPHPIRTVRHDENLGFAKSCNDGARIANGEYLVFLNNDTIVLANWIDAMVTAAEENQVIGVVGNLQVFPDRKLVQQAGIVCGEGNIVYSIYNNQLAADHPAVNRAREMTFVAGSCMLVPKDLFHSLNGFDETYLNSCEDLDFCMKVHSAGRCVWYCPQSRIHHFESKTVSGHSKISNNYRYFQDKWGHLLRRNDKEIYIQDGFDPPPDGLDATTLTQYHLIPGKRVK